jgi:L-ribulokinase
VARKYALGIDFGSLSARALLIDVKTGKEVATTEREYTHGFIEDTLPGTGEKLMPDWTLQHPQDYLDVMDQTVSEVIRLAGVDPADIIGVGIDFTACTMLPIKADGTPLCFLPEYRANKHAYVKLWKHHAASSHANRLNEIATARGETFLARYGGKISSEWLFPKIWQIAEEAPEIYHAADRFIEAADWIVMVLTGRETRNSCTAGYKGMWSKREGFPQREFFAALNPLMVNVVEEKLSKDIMPIGSKAGEVTEEAAQRIGLRAGTPVAVGNVDAHVAVPACGITREGQMLMIMGTSTCHLFLGQTEKNVPGMCGVVEDGILPGFLGYEAGQSCVGDHFDWFVRQCVPASYSEGAAAAGVSIHQYLREKAMRYKPGESGLVALDWWNGNRSVLVDVDLTGLLIGLTLATKPEEIYRALIEATAYGTREIIETFEASGLPIYELFACGGIASKDPFMMQIYADVTGRKIRISDSKQTVALGAAMFGAVVAGKANGGFDSIFEAARVIPRLKDVVYQPDPQAVADYDRLFAEYRILHDYFGRGANDVMKRLKELKRARYAENP